MVERTQALTDASAPASNHQGSYFDWPAMFGGAVVAAAIGILFSGFGAAVGLSAVSPLSGEGSGGFALIIVGAWLLITTVAAYGAGGYIAGRMRRRMDAAAKADEVAARDSMHGAVVWGLGVLLSAFLAASALGSAAKVAGDVAQGAASAVGGAVQGIGSAAGAAGGAVDGMNINPLQIVNDRLLRGTGVQLDADPTLPDGAMAVLGDVARTGEITEDDRAYLATTLAANSNLSQTEAEARVDQAAAEVVALRDTAQAKIDEVEATAREAADAARTAAVLSGFALAAALLIAAAAAIWGAAVGGRHRDEGRLFAGFRSF